MTAIAEVSVGQMDLSPDGTAFPIWSPSTPTDFERSGEPFHKIADGTPTPAYKSQDVAGINPPALPPVAVLEKPAVHSPSIIIHNPAQLIAPHDAIATAFLNSQERPLPSGSAAWHEKVAKKAYQRLARETGYTPDDIRTIRPGDNLYEQIHANRHLGTLWNKAQKHERHILEVREKQAAAYQARADDLYAADYARKMYEPERVARETAMQATDAKVAHVLYTDGKPAPGVPFEGYAQNVDVGGNLMVATHPDFDLRIAQDLALKAEETMEAARVAQNDLTRAQIAGDPGAAYLMAGMPIAALVSGSGRFGKLLGLTLGSGLVLSACGGAPALENPTAHPPTLPPEPTHINPPTIGAPATPDAGTQFLAPNNQPRQEFLHGIAPPFGGEGVTQETLIADVQPALQREGFLPIGQEVAGNSGNPTRNVASFEQDRNGVTTCIAIAPAEIYAPDEFGGSSERLKESNGVVLYGEPGPDGKPSTSDDIVATKVIATTSLTGLPDSVACVNAVVTDPQNPAGLGATEMLLVDTATSTIMGQMPAAFSGDTSVQIVNGDKGPTVLVDGEKLTFTLRPGVSLETATPPHTSTPEPSATPAPESTMLQDFEKLGIAFPDRLQAESDKDGLKTRVVLSEALMKNTGITDLNIPQNQLDQIGKYILGVFMWGNRTANPNLSAFSQFSDLKVDGDKIVALSESVLKNDQGVTLKLSDGQRTIEGQVSSLQMVFMTTGESDRILEGMKRGNVSYIDRTFVNGNTKSRFLFSFQENTLTAVFASNSKGIEMPFSGGAKYLVNFESYQQANPRNKTEKLVDFGTMLNYISRILVDSSPARDKMSSVFNDFSGPIPNFLCSGSWDMTVARKNNAYWRGEGGKLFGCDPAAIKLFSPKTP